MNNQVFNNEGAVINIEVFHPGEFLLEEIQERGILKRDVAQKLEIMPHHLSAIFAGKRNISPKLAVKLEELLGVSAEYWIGLQSAWELQEARNELSYH